MIVLSGSIRHDGSRRDELHDALVAGMSAAASDRGHHAYRFTADLTDPNLVHIFEWWDDEESFTEHQHAPHAQALLQQLGGLGIVEATMTRFDVSSHRREF